jgi:predicted ester cyclase
MSKEADNKAVVGQWFAKFWGKTVDLSVVDEIAAPDMLLPADLIAEGDHVVGRWEGGGTHTGPAFSDFLMGSLPAATGRKMHFTGTTVLKLAKGKIVEEIGLDDGVTALKQLGLIRQT